MRFAAMGVTLAIVLFAAGCSGTGSNKPAPFDPSQGTSTDKVRWGVQFATANGTSGWLPDDTAGQTKIIEALSKGSCSFYDHGGTIKDGINQQAVQGKLGQHDTIVYTAVAVTAYCPKHKPEFDALMGANNVVLKPTSWTPADNHYGGPTSTDTTPSSR